MKRQAPPLLVILSTALALVGCGDDKTPAGEGGAAGVGGGLTSGSSAGGAGASSSGGASAGTATGGGGATGAGGSGSGTGGAGGSGTGGAGGSGTDVGGAAAGSTGNGDFPPLNMMDDARKLNDADKGLLCDWINETLGGYGVATDCGSITTSNDRDQAQCVETRFRYNCKVTVQEVRDCTLATAPSHACNTDFQECHALRCIE